MGAEMTDFFECLAFLHIAARAYDGAYAAGTARIVEHRRYPRGFDEPGFVTAAIYIGGVCQRYLETACLRMAPAGFLLKNDGAMEPIIHRRAGVA